ncbi:MAG: hypothetical protein Kow00121_30710 [Elainellaceae cyanobacterium]
MMGEETSMQTQMQGQDRTAQDRTHLLSTIAQVANLLLRSPSYDAAFPDVVRLLGEAAGSDRCTITQEFIEPQSNKLAVKLHTEWCQPRVPSVLARFPEFHNGIIYKNADHLFQQLLQGEAVNFVVAELQQSEWKAFFEAQHNRSMLIVPIMVQGECWGHIGFDNCRAPQLYDEAEIAILNIAADSIAAAIERQTKDVELRKIQENLLQAEQARSQELEHLNTELQQAIDRLQTRDRLFEVTVMAVNALLSINDFDEAVNKTLQILGEGLQADRVKVLEHSFNPRSNPLPSYSTVTYEWVTPGTVSQMAHPSSSQIDTRDADEAFMQQVANNGFGGLLHEWDQSLWSAFEAVQAKAIYSVPIRVQDQVWGAFIFDDCHQVKQRNPVEMAVLKIGANCIGSAIERKRSQQTLLEAEQRRAAELAKTNQALKKSLDTLATNPDIDRFIGQLLSAIAIQFKAPVVEYWRNDSKQTLSLEMLHWQQQIYERSQVVNLFPQHPGAGEYLVPETFLNGVLPSQRYHPLYIPDLAASALANMVGWYEQQGIQQLLSLPMTLGNESIGAIAIYLYADQRFTTEAQELAQALTHQATLAIQLTRLAEEAKQFALIQERAFTAREIHDTLAQDFGGILMQLQAVDRHYSLKPEKAQGHITQARNLARRGLAEARSSIWMLSQEGEVYSNLSQGLQQLVEQIANGSETQTTITITGIPYSLSPIQGMNLLRIAQESLNNALRHAHAQTISLLLAYAPDKLHLQIIDDGIGFTLPSPGTGFGLRSMQQRADSIGAQFNVQSQLGQGATVVVLLPINHSKAADCEKSAPPSGIA